MKKKRLSDMAFEATNTLIMIIIVAFTAYPFLYILLYSVSNGSRVSGSFLIFPVGFSFEAYQACITNANILGGVVVSVARSTITPALAILITSMAAYALSKPDLAGRKFFLRLILFTMYFSSGIIPTYILITKLHLKGTFWVYVFPYLVNVFEMVLIKTYIEGLPAGLEEAALIDGANEIATFFRIILPVCTPVLVAVIMFECINQWNMFYDTLLYNAEKSKYHTLQYVLVNFLQNRVNTLDQAKSGSSTQAITAMSLKMAMTVIIILPIAMVYPFLQKYFVKGLLIGSIKG